MDRINLNFTIKSQGLTPKDLTSEEQKKVLSLGEKYY